MNAFQDKLAAILAAVPTPAFSLFPYLSSFFLSCSLYLLTSFCCHLFHSFWGLYTVSISHFLFFSLWSFPCLPIYASPCLIFSLCFLIPSLYFCLLGSIFTLRPLLPAISGKCHFCSCVKEESEWQPVAHCCSSLHLNCLETEAWKSQMKPPVVQSWGQGGMRTMPLPLPLLS